MLAVSLTLAGCGGGGVPTNSATAPNAGPSYSSHTFTVPLAVTLSKTLNAGSVSDTKHLLTWDEGANPDNKVRFLSPVEVYPPPPARGVSPSVTPTPQKYAQYVLSLGKGSAKITNVVRSTVDGRPATLMTLTNDGAAQNGSLGCAEHGNDPVEECFGIQPDYELRFAVMNSGPPLAIWARTSSEHPDQDFLTSFERMLRTVRFQ